MKVGKIDKNLLQNKSCDTCYRLNTCIFDSIKYCSIVDVKNAVDNGECNHIPLPEKNTCEYWIK